MAHDTCTHVRFFGFNFYFSRIQGFCLPILQFTAPFKYVWSYYYHSSIIIPPFWPKPYQHPTAPPGTWCNKVAFPKEPGQMFAKRRSLWYLWFCYPHRMCCLDSILFFCRGWFGLPNLYIFTVAWKGQMETSSIWSMTVSLQWLTNSGGRESPCTMWVLEIGQQTHLQGRFIGTLPVYSWFNMSNSDWAEKTSEDEYEVQRWVVKTSRCLRKTANTGSTKQVTHSHVENSGLWNHRPVQ